MGQTCVSANRIFVEASVEAFTQKLVKRLGALKVGNGLDPDVAVGPLIEDAAMEKVEPTSPTRRRRAQKSLSAASGSRSTEPGAATSTRPRC
jgi:succinate-semialdehyde dehydrogenase / glutarate-semialdehyde dehydrogenase